MGDRLTEDEAQQTETRSYGDIFDEYLPEYMAIGMTYDEYWDGEFGTKRAARKAYQIRMKNEQMVADRLNWYMGQYIMSALNATPLLVAGFNVKNSTNTPEYIDKPILEKAEENQKEEIRKKNEEDQMMMAMAMMQTAFNQFNKRFERQNATGQKPESDGK